MLRMFGTLLALSDSNQLVQFSSLSVCISDSKIHFADGEFDWKTSLR